jgi:pantoate--beta-alanine ligase
MFYLLILLLQMKLVRQIIDLNKAIKDNYELGFVPTMGGLHEGHISLIKQSKKKCKQTLVSIFVNPKQFNSNRDYKSYPRNINKDLKILQKLKVDFVFLPNGNEIYKEKKIPKFKLNREQKILCAKYRKGHFEGVLDIMDRFIKLILPKFIFMGEKDFQQIFLIKENFEQKYKTKIVTCKTIRDLNNIALSTRNFLLKNDEIKIAGLIVKKLILLKSKINRNRSISKSLINNFKKEIKKEVDIKIEYLEARNIINLKSNITHKKFKLFVAYYIDNIRLIDNL